MPRTRRTVGGVPRVFDARPDRADLRDRKYSPKLESLPACYPSRDAVRDWFAAYSAARMVGDQRAEGSCTGWGLRGVVNYLLWRRDRDAHDDGGARVSARMLYHLARIYDEWDGEDYEGSSCRGAMKGWHRHGVCSEDLWPYADAKGRFRKPLSGWEEDAATRPLGAYYRIDTRAINDLQAAINEVGAVYASADVHRGWGLVRKAVVTDIDALPVIAFNRRAEGGHAFCFVGYNADGFIVQNSWGTDWGYQGFAVLGYDDWVANGMDAWVAVLGAPMRVRAGSSAGTRVSRSLQVRVAAHVGAQVSGSDAGAKVAPLTRPQALLRSAVIGNEGRPLRRLLEHETATDALRHLSIELPAAWLATAGDAPPRLAIYAHGGLNDEEAGLDRAQVLAPYFEANGIRPLFLVWRTGVVESLRNILSDVADSVLPWRSGSWLGDAVEWAHERKDRSVEMAARIAVKPLWSEMKENAGLAATPGGATWLLASNLAVLQQQVPGLELHLVGHSAGSIILGDMLPLLQRQGLRVKSLQLLAPACTLQFALDRFGSQLQPGGVLEKALVRVHNLSDGRELDDSVGPYGKSLLYLVSRALEARHKTPLLGLARVWSGRPERDEWQDGTDLVKAWQKLARERDWHTERDEKKMHDGVEHIDSAHGAFDNDVRTISDVLRAIRRKALLTPVSRLRGF